MSKTRDRKRELLKRKIYVKHTREQEIKRLLETETSPVLRHMLQMNLRFPINRDFIDKIVAGTNENDLAYIRTLNREEQEDVIREMADWR
ncbi:MAG TPA: hypothetical protein VN081_02470 [Dongiaceae bacterium]|nr:hypothetical protein [Dongiaceae bacterium]